MAAEGGGGFLRGLARRVGVLSGAVVGGWRVDCRSRVVWLREIGGGG